MPNEGARNALTEAAGYDGLLQKRLEWEDSVGYLILSGILPLVLVFSVFPAIPGAVYWFRSWAPISIISKSSFFQLWIGTVALFGMTYIIASRVLNSRKPGPVSDAIRLSVLPFLVAQLLDRYQTTRATDLLAEAKRYNALFLSLWRRIALCGNRLAVVNVSDLESAKRLLRSLFVPFSKPMQLCELLRFPWFEIGTDTRVYLETIEAIESRVSEPLQGGIVYEKHPDAFRAVCRFCYELRPAFMPDGRIDATSIAAIQELIQLIGALPPYQRETLRPKVRASEIALAKAKGILAAFYRNEHMAIRLLSWFCTLALLITPACYIAARYVFNVQFETSGATLLAISLGVPATLSIPLANDKVKAEEPK